MKGRVGVVREDIREDIGPLAGHRCLSHPAQGGHVEFWDWDTQTLPDFSKEARYPEFHVEFPNLRTLCELNKARLYAEHSPWAPAKLQGVTSTAKAQEAAHQAD